MKINNRKISEVSWRDVDRAQLKEDLKTSGTPGDIRECFLFVGDLEKTSTWAFPHHQIVDGELSLSRSGVHTVTQNLISTGTVGLPRKSAARHVLKHFKSLNQEPPESLVSLSKFHCYEQAWTELQMLTVLMNIGPASGYGPDYFIRPKTAGGSQEEIVELSGIWEEIPGIVSEMESLPVLGVSVKEFSLEEVLQAIESLVDQDLVEPAEAPEVREDVKSIVQRKGGQLQEDLQTLSCKANLAFTNMGKRSKKDYHPSKDELWLINQGYSNVELQPEEVLVFTLTSADQELDRQNEQFSTKALETAATLSLDKAFLIDHKWETPAQVGKIFAAEAADGKLMQKVYMLNDPINDMVIKNILAGIYNKVSVGFASNLKDMICNSCQDKSIYDSACPHMPGSTDDQGNKTTVTIQDVSDYYEVSLVPIPAQKEAGIRRRSVTLTPEMAKALDSNSKTAAAVVKESLSESVGSDPSKSVGTINLENDQGDLSVSKSTIADSKPEDMTAVPAVQVDPKAAVSEDGDQEDDDKALTTGEVAGQVNTELEGEGMDDIPNNPAEPAAPAAQAPVYDKAFSKELKKLRKGLAKSVEKLSEITEKLSAVKPPDSAEVKSLSERLEKLTKFVELASSTTVESLERKVKPAPTKAADSNEWASDLTRSILGGKQ